MKKIFFSIIVTGTFVLLLFGSCEKDRGPVTIKPVQPVDSSLHYISFKGYLQPLFNDYCIGCHNSNHPFLDLRGVVSYEQLLFSGSTAPYVDSINPDNSLLVQRVVGVEWPVMPPEPPGISASDLDSIRLWMLQGCRDN